MYGMSFFVFLLFPTSDFIYSLDWFNYVYGDEGLAITAYNIELVIDTFQVCCILVWYFLVGVSLVKQVSDIDSNIHNTMWFLLRTPIWYLEAY